MTASDDAALVAMRDSIALALDVEGPAGGPLTVEQFQTAVDYYGQQYASFPPLVLAGEIHRCRSLLVDVLAAGPPSDRVRQLRQPAGWLSALLGNLAFHLADPTAAHVHLGTASRLGTEVGDEHLITWSLGLHAMVARFQHRHAEGLDLAAQALEHATTPIRRAQILAWAQLRNLADLGDRDGAHEAMDRARREMDADPNGEEHGRFGFDLAELELFSAEAHLALDEHRLAGIHAQAAIGHTRPGRSAWAAASVVFAASEVGQRRADQAIALANDVLDEIPPAWLREPDRRRLQDLCTLLSSQTSRPAGSHELRDRLVGLAPLARTTERSPEPNGH